MNKLVTLLLVLIVIPAVYADIKLDGFSKLNYNLGDNIDVNGYVIESAEVQGILKMELVCNETVPVYFNLINLGVNERYGFSQTVPIRESMVGECYLSVKLEEDDRVVSEADSEIISISNELRLDAVTNKINYDPGEEVVVSGSVETSNGNIVDKASVVVEVDGRKYNEEVSNGMFENVFNLAYDVKSGEYNILVSVEDDFGNIGEGEISIKVESVVSKIEVDIDRLMFKPNEEVSFIPKVYDQADELMTESVVFELVNDNEVKDVVNVNSDEEYRFKLDEFASPGVWVIRLRNGDVVKEQEITVDEVKEIKMWLGNSTLFVKNIGNVDYNDEIEVDLKGDKTFKITKTRTIIPGQTVSIDLEDEVPDGEYEVVTPGNLVTGNVVLGTGEGKVNVTKTAGYVVLGILFLFLIYMVARRGKKGNVVNREREKKEGKKMLEKLKTPQKKPRFGFSEPKVNEGDIKHWVEKATGEKQNDDKKGLFEMFK